MKSPRRTKPEAPIEFETIEEAYAHLRATLDPGSSIDIHEESCSLAFDGPECTCVPMRLTSGHEA